MASIFTPNVSSSLVFLYSIFVSFSTSAPFLSSSTILIPFLSDAFEISTISFVFLFSTSEITSDINLLILAPIIV